jgi:DNA processing protein
VIRTAQEMERSNASELKGRRIWYLGNLALLSMPTVSVIGTRNPSNEGIVRTRKVVRILVENGFCVVSGLARGIDSVAHQQTLDLNGFTVAVMGTPIHLCYPKENASLKNRIAEDGLVISQFPPEQKIRPDNFPQRNALMAELGLLTIVTEAGQRSGTRHQVRSAVNLGRKVGFLASMVDRNYTWVSEALDSGFATVIQTPEDLLGILRDLKLQTETPRLQKHAASWSDDEAQSPRQLVSMSPEEDSSCTSQDMEMEADSSGTHSQKSAAAQVRSRTHRASIFLAVLRALKDCLHSLLKRL